MRKIFSKSENLKLLYYRTLQNSWFKIYLQHTLSYYNQGATHYFNFIGKYSCFFFLLTILSRHDN